MSRSQIADEFKSLHIIFADVDIVARIYFVRGDRQSVYSRMRRLHKGTPIWSNNENKMVLVKACGNIMTGLPANAANQHNIPYYSPAPVGNPITDFSADLPGLRSAPPSAMELIDLTAPIVGPGLGADTDDSPLLDQPEGFLSSSEIPPMGQDLLAAPSPGMLPGGNSTNLGWLAAGLPLLALPGTDHHGGGSPPAGLPPPVPVPEAGTLVALAVGATLFAVSVRRKFRSD